MFLKKVSDSQKPKLNVKESCIFFRQKWPYFSRIITMFLFQTKIQLKNGTKLYVQNIIHRVDKRKKELSSAALWSHFYVHNFVLIKHILNQRASTLQGCKRFNNSIKIY